MELLLPSELEFFLLSKEDCLLRNLLRLLDEDITFSLKININISNIECIYIYKYI
jgi:hypothetical protein